MDVSDGAESGSEKFFLRHLAHAPKTANGKGREDFPFSAVGDDAEAVRLFHVTRHLGKEFIRRDADRGCEMHGGTDFLFDGAPDRSQRWILVSHAGDVEKGFVQGNRLVGVRVVEHDLMDRIRRLTVRFEARRDEAAMGAEALCLREGHRRMHAKGASFVGRGRDDAPAALPADDDGLALERGVVPLLDGRKKGVHIDMHDPATHTNPPL